MVWALLAGTGLDWPDDPVWFSFVPFSFSPIYFLNFFI
jgi:hypothetical protein